MNDRFGQDRDPTGGEAIASAGSVGEVLRAERMRRGWTLADAEIYLKIRRSMLEAIEQGRFELLPGRAYALAFARTYAEFLGLNAEDIVSRCRTELRNAGEPETGAGSGSGILGDIDLPRVGMAAAAVVAVILAGLWMFEGGSGDGAARGDAQAPQAQPARDGTDAVRATASAVPTVPTGPGIAAAMPPPPPPAPQPSAAGTAAAQRGAAGSTDPTSAQASPYPGVTPQSVQAAAAVAAASRAAPPPPVPPTSRISLKANGDTWVEIRDQAGASVLARTLRNGEVYNVPDRPGLVLSSGRINTIEVRVDGQVVSPQGRPARREMSLDPARLLQNAQAQAPSQPAGAAPAASDPPPAAAPVAGPASPQAVPPTRAQRRGNAPQPGPAGSGPVNNSAPAGATGN
jgi:cytoskeleton protein RodZ